MTFKGGWGNRLLSITAGLALVLVVVNILLVFGNQNLQSEIGERQQFIARSIQLEQLHRQLVAVLATLAVKTNDAQLQQMLAEKGIDLDNPQASGGAPAEGKAK